MLHAGLIGDPIGHSLSPVLHTAAFAHCGIAGQYALWPTTASALPERVATLRQPDVLGANVTLPHKIAVLPLLDRVDPQVEVIGAVNTIVREADGSLTGANTDLPAFLAALREDGGYAPQGQTAVILGASGAARATAMALVGAGVASLMVVNRTLERAEALLGDVLAAADGDPQLLACTPATLDHDMLRAATLIVNATSLGWRAEETPLAAQYLSAHALVFDMVYRRTQLLRDAEARGARTVDGLGMLVRQAALAFERWTGCTVPLQVLYAAVEQQQKAHV